MVDGPVVHCVASLAASLTLTTAICPLDVIYQRTRASLHLPIISPSSPHVSSHVHVCLLASPHLTGLAPCICILPCACVQVHSWTRAPCTVWRTGHLHSVSCWPFNWPSVQQPICLRRFTRCRGRAGRPLTRLGATMDALPSILHTDVSHLRAVSAGASRQLSGLRRAEILRPSLLGSYLVLQSGLEDMRRPTPGGRRASRTRRTVSSPACEAC